MWLPNTHWRCSDTQSWLCLYVATRWYTSSGVYVCWWWTVHIWQTSFHVRQKQWWLISFLPHAITTLSYKYSPEAMFCTASVCSLLSSIQSMWLWLRKWIPLKMPGKLCETLSSQKLPVDLNPVHIKPEGWVQKIYINKILVKHTIIQYFSIGKCSL